MTLDPGPWWLRWLPADSRAGVQRRALIVWGVAAAIALLQSFFSPEQHPLAASLVYSYAISTSIWFLCDPLRIALRRHGPDVQRAKRPFGQQPHQSAGLQGFVRVHAAHQRQPQPGLAHLLDGPLVVAGNAGLHPQGPGFA